MWPACVMGTSSSYRVPDSGRERMTAPRSRPRPPWPQRCKLRAVSSEVRWCVKKSTEVSGARGAGSASRCTTAVHRDPSSVKLRTRGGSLSPKMAGVAQVPLRPQSNCTLPADAFVATTTYGASLSAWRWAWVAASPRSGARVGRMAGIAVSAWTCDLHVDCTCSILSRLPRRRSYEAPALPRLRSTATEDVASPPGSSPASPSSNV
mmetsp:Transcript_24978/g.73361  ORF Transcript_24978/g.73361 Transcript_24978/m.73361 type:complete len:207 (-) Transcript_24978:707-1327(-)